MTLRSLPTTQARRMYFDASVLVWINTRLKTGAVREQAGVSEIKGSLSVGLFSAFIYTGGRDLQYGIQLSVKGKEDRIKRI